MKNLLLFAFTLLFLLSQLSAQDKWSYHGISQTMYGMHDMGDKIWIATSRGMILFSKKSKSFSYDTRGLVPTPSSFAAGPDNTLYIGTQMDLLTLEGNSWRPVRKDGKPLEQGVITTAMDQSATLWLATSQGLLSYTGSSWNTLDMSNSKLPSNRIWALAVDSSNNKWIGTGEGLIRLSGSAMTVYTTLNSALPSNLINSIAVDTQGTVWIGTDGGVVRADQDKWTTFTTANSKLPVNEVNYIYPAKSGTIWFGPRNGGLAGLKGSEWTLYNTQNSPLNEKSVYSALEDGESTLWIGGRDTLYSVQNGTWNRYRVAPAKVPASAIYSLTARPNNDIYAASTGIIYRYNGQWSVLDTNGSVINFRGIGLLEFDRDTLWCTFRYAGIAKYDGKAWTVYNSSTTGLALDTVLSMTIDKQGVKWFGTSQGLARFDNQSWTLLKPTELAGSKTNRINCIAAGPDNAIWFSTVESGLIHIKDNQWTVYPKNTQNPVLSTHDMAIDRNNVVWILPSLDSTIYSLDNGKWTAHKGILSGFGGSINASIAIDSSNSIWISSKEKTGLTKYDGSTWQRYTRDMTGLPKDGFNLTIAADGTVWGTDGTGIITNRNQTTPVEEYPVNFSPDGTVFPNPAHSFAFIRLHNALDARIELFDPLSKAVPSVAMHEEGGIRLDVSSLPQGLYYCRVTTSSGTNTYPLVIMR